MRPVKVVRGFSFVKTMMLFLKPWESLPATTSIQFFERELLREIAALHALYGRRLPHDIDHSGL
jgi:hypothetical protein